MKTEMPPNVMANGYISYIKSKVDVLFSGEEMDEIVLAINSGILPKTMATRRAHVESLKARYESVTTCPKCGGELFLRTSKTGANAGKQFYGCGKYPACRYVKQLDGAE